MKQWKLEMLALVTMVLALGLAAIIAVFGGGYWAFVPMIAWFILGQIFVVPKILGGSYRWGLFLLTVLLMTGSVGLAVLIDRWGGGWFMALPVLVWLLWACFYTMPKINKSVERHK